MAGKYGDEPWVVETGVNDKSKIFPNLSVLEENAVARYTSNSFQVNAKLRKGDDAGAEIRLLDAAFEKSTLAAPQKVRRIVADRSLMYEMRSLSKSNGVYTERAYMSTQKTRYGSLDEAVDDFAQGARSSDIVVMEMNLPKGMHAIDVGNKLDKHKAALGFDQGEVLLPRNTKWNVVSARVDSEGRTIVQLKPIQVKSAKPTVAEPRLLDKDAVDKLDNLKVGEELARSQNAAYKYSTDQRALGRSAADVFDDPVYKAMREELALLYRRAADLQKAAAAQRALSRVGVHPRVDKLNRLPVGTPATLRSSTMDGVANPKGKGWSSASTPLGYDVNCTRVSATVEMRARGYDVKAAPVKLTADKSDTWIQSNWVDPKTGKSRRLTKAKDAKVLMAKMTKEIPDGARFFVVAAWKRGGAHIWNAEKVNGKIIFHEGQARVSGSGTPEFTARRLESMDFDWWNTNREASVRFMRVDDLEPTDKVIRAFE